MLLGMHSIVLLHSGHTVSTGTRPRRGLLSRAQKHYYESDDADADLEPGEITVATNNQYVGDSTNKVKILFIQY